MRTPFWTASMQSSAWGTENAGLEYAGPYFITGKCRTGKHRTGKWRTAAMMLGMLLMFALCSRCDYFIALIVHRCLQHNAVARVNTCILWRRNWLGPSFSTYAIAIRCFRFRSCIFSHGFVYRAATLFTNHSAWKLYSAVNSTLASALLLVWRDQESADKQILAVGGVTIHGVLLRDWVVELSSKCSPNNEFICRTNVHQRSERCM